MIPYPRAGAGREDVASGKKGGGKGGRDKILVRFQNCLRESKPIARRYTRFRQKNTRGGKGGLLSQTGINDGDMQERSSNEESTNAPAAWAPSLTSRREKKRRERLLFH